MRRAFLAESAERAYNGRVGGQWGSGLMVLATESLIDAVWYPLVPIYRLIGPTAAAALLVLFLVGILRMMLDIVIRAIAIGRIRGCGRWLMGAFWGTLIQVAVAPVQWAMDKGRIVGRAVTYQMIAEAACREIEDAEAEPGGGGWTLGSQDTSQQFGQALELVQRVPRQEGHRPDLPSPHHQGRADYYEELGG
jgi:hypothetical protein